MNEDIKKPIKEWQSDANKDSTKLSDINRSLAFGGIAIIWIFKNSDLNCHIIPDSLIWPLIFIIASLGFDYAQYLWKMLNEYRLYYRIEKLYDNKKISDAEIQDVKIGNYFRNITWIIFSLKLISLIIGYVLIFCYLTQKL